MPKFIAVTSKGLEPALEQELKALGLKGIQKAPTGFQFEASWKDCYRLNLQLRTATRVLYPILDFPAYDPDEIYNNLMKHDFTKYITPAGSLAVVTSGRSKTFKDSRFVSLKVKDAIVDQFWKKYDSRPDVDKDNADLPIQVRLNENSLSVAIDTSGNSLAQRGYRPMPVRAPLREHMAAALVLLSGWKPDQVLVDPMCGSATFLIEAALIAKKIAPGTLRKSFAFQKWLGFQEEAWSEVLDQAIEQEDEDLEIKMFGYDCDWQTVQTARQCIKNAGFEEEIQVEKCRVDQLELQPEMEKGMMIVNPPYGQRLSTPFEVKDAYKDLAFALKKTFRGWSCWLLSGNPLLTQELKMKATRKYPVFNGQLECRFIHYQVNK